MVITDDDDNDDASNMMVIISIKSINIISAIDLFILVVFVKITKGWIFYQPATRVASSCFDPGLKR